MCDIEIERERVRACVQGSERERKCACVVCPRALVCLFCYRNAFILVHLSSRAKLFFFFFFCRRRRSQPKLLSETLATKVFVPQKQQKLGKKEAKAKQLL